MLGWLKLARPKTRNSKRFSRKLVIEPLESRDNPSAPTLTFSAAILSGNQVSLSGQVTCDGDPTACHVDFAGLVGDSTTVNADGSYSVLETPSTLGTIYARATDGSGQQSDLQSATIRSNAPILTLTRTYGANGTVILTGYVTDEDQAGRTVTFGGAVSGTTTTDSDGDFTFTATNWNGSAGTVYAQTTDPWGLTSNTLTAALSNSAPGMASFAASHNSGYLWTFQGQITDEYAPGLTVRLSGIPSLNGTNGYTEVTVGDDGYFSYTVQLLPEESGTFTAQTWDWWGAASNIRTDTVYNHAIPMG
jgi:hypothetical protein